MKKLIIFLIICFTTTLSYATDPDSLRIYPPQQPMVFRGLDDTSSPVFIEDGRGRAVENVKFTSTGGLSKRYGFSLIDETLDDYDLSFPAITGIYDAQFSNGNSYPIATVGKKLKYNSGSAWVEISGATITTGADNQFVFETANDTVIMTNDVDVPIELSSGLTASALDVSDLSDTLTKAKCVNWFRNHLIFANTVENSVERPTRIRWSDVGTTESWDDDNFIDIATLGGEEINAMAQLYGDLYIFLDQSIYKVSYVGGAEIYILSQVADDVGCTSKNGVQNVTLPNNQKGLIFFDRNEIVYLFNGIAPVDISENIGDLIDGFNDARLAYIVTGTDEDSFYLAGSISGASTNNTLLEFDYSFGEWIKHTNINCNAIARVQGSNNIIKTYYGNYVSMVYWLDNTSLSSDVDGIVGIVSLVYQDANRTYSTATGLQMIVPTVTGLTVDALIGGIIEITGGTAVGESKVIVENTATGILVDSDFTTTPDSTSSFTIGAIDAIYTTKWYDLGEPARIKSLRNLYLWGDAQQNVSHTLKYYKDFGDEIESKSISMSTGASALWGTAVWGSDTWGASATIFKVVPLTGAGRYFSFSFEESDIDEDMYIYGWNVIYDVLDVE